MAVAENPPPGERPGAAAAGTPASSGRSARQQRARERAARDEKLEVARNTADESERSRALVGMAEHLSSRQVLVALEIAKSIGDEGARHTALAALAERVPTEGAEAGTPRRIAELAVQWTRGRWADRLLMLVSFAMIAVVFAGLAWVCWLWWMPAVWAWGFDRFGWASLIAPFGILYLVIIPFVAVWLAQAIVSFWTEFGALRQDVASARETQKDIEAELKANDSQGLILLLSYSRAMLSEYYAIAMSQAQRSFRYCLIAMWLGFIVLIAGAIDSFIPLAQFVTLAGTERAVIAAVEADPVDANSLVLITGAVIEFIAAAFLWVYRFSIQQQTYYYRRQLRLHNTLLAHRLTAGMHTRDEATKMIVERLLEDMERPASELRGSSGISGLVKR